MLMLAVGSGLVVLLIVGAGQERNWRWMVPDGREAVARQPVRRVPAPVVVAMADTGSQSDEKSKGVPSEKASEKVPVPFFPGVRLDYLSAVRDDTVFRAAESDAWFHLLAVLARTPNDELVGASEGPVAYLQLDQQPNEYRGRLVTVSGVVRAAKLVAPPANAFNVSSYYQLWLQPSATSNALVALYCLELPPDFPLGARLDAECTATGFFFKRWAYPSQGGITTAPLLLARTLDWQPPAVAVPPPAMAPTEQALLAIAIALVLAVAVLGYLVWRARATIKPRVAAPGDDNVGAALASLDRESARDPTHP